MNRHVIFLLISLIVLKAAWVATHPLVADEYVHYYLSEYILQHGVPYLFQEQYLVPNWSISQLPLFHYILAAFLLVFSVEASRYLMAIVIPLITTYFVWKLFYRYDSTGIMAVLMNFVPIYFIWTTTAFYIEATYVMFSVMAIYFYLKDSRWWILAYIADMLLKYYIAAGIGLVFIYDSYRKRKWKKFAVFVLLTLILVPVHFYVNRMTMSVVESGYSAKYDSSPVLLFISMAVAIYPNELFQFEPFYTAMLLFTSGIVLFLVMSPKLWKDNKLEILWFLTYASFMVFGSPDTRRLVMIAPLVFLSVWIAVKDKRVRNIIVIFTLAAFMINLVNLWTTFGYTECFYEANDFLTTLPQDAVIMSPYMYETSYFTNRTVVGLNLNLNTNGATHLVVVKGWYDTDHWYNFLIPAARTLEGNGWTRVYENHDIYVLARDKV